MNNDDFEQFKEFNAWRNAQSQQKDQPMGVLEIKPEPKSKQSEILVPIHYVWLAAIGGLILLVAAWPFTLLGFFIGLFVRFKFFGDKS